MPTGFAPNNNTLSPHSPERGGAVEVAADQFPEQHLSSAVQEAEEIVRSAYRAHQEAAAGPEYDPQIEAAQIETVRHASMEIIHARFSELEAQFANEVAQK